MIHQLKSFFREETGAVTVDWVVITAAVVGLAIAAYTTLSGQAMDLAGSASTSLDAEEDVVLVGAGD